MRSYHQYCGLAKALDVIGDRWTLLIVRELLLRERCRYTDLRNGLPGIATNLLADRLRELEEAGIVSREEAPPPIATTVFRLTSRGRELEPIVNQIGGTTRFAVIGSACQQGCTLQIVPPSGPRSPSSSVAAMPRL